MLVVEQLHIQRKSVQKIWNALSNFSFSQKLYTPNLNCNNYSRKLNAHKFDAFKEGGDVMYYFLKKLKTATSLSTSLQVSRKSLFTNLYLSVIFILPVFPRGKKIFLWYNLATDSPKNFGPWSHITRGLLSFYVLWLTGN